MFYAHVVNQIDPNPMCCLLIGHSEYTYIYIKLDLNPTCCLLIGEAEIDLLLIYQALSFARLVMLLMFYCLTFIEAE